MSIWVGIKIWARAIAINAGLWFVGSLLFGEMEGVLLAVFFLFAGFFFTLPLLLLVMPLVYFSCRLPYSLHSKICWLGFYLLLIAVAFLLIILTFFNSGFQFVKTDYRLIGCVCVSIIISLALSRRSIAQISNSINEKRLFASKYSTSPVNKKQA